AVFSRLASAGMMVSTLRKSVIFTRLAFSLKLGFFLLFFDLALDLVDGQIDRRIEILVLLLAHDRRAARVQGMSKIFAHAVHFLLGVLFQGLGGLGMAKRDGNLDLAHGAARSPGPITCARTAAGAWRKEGCPWPRGIWPPCAGRFRSSRWTAPRRYAGR